MKSLRRTLLNRSEQVAAVLLFLPIAGAGLALGGSAGHAMVQSVLLACLLAVPVALRIGTVADVWRRRYVLLAVALVATLGWDVWTGVIAGRRTFLSEWPLVYSSAVLTFSLVYICLASLATALRALGTRLSRDRGADAAGRAET